MDQISIYTSQILKNLIVQPEDKRQKVESISQHSQYLLDRLLVKFIDFWLRPPLKAARLPSGLANFGRTETNLCYWLLSFVTRSSIVSLWACPTWRLFHVNRSWKVRWSISLYRAWYYLVFQSRLMLSMWP